MYTEPVLRKYNFFENPKFWKVITVINTTSLLTNIRRIMLPKWDRESFKGVRNCGEYSKLQLHDIDGHYLSPSYSHADQAIHTAGVEHAERPTIRKYVFNITVKHPGERPRQKRRQSKRSTILSAAAWLSRFPAPVLVRGERGGNYSFFLVITLSRGREKFKTYPKFLSRQRGCKRNWDGEIVKRLLSAFGMVWQQDEK